MKYHPAKIGLLQAVGQSAYIFFIVSLLQTLESWARAAEPIQPPIMLLTLFVLSALISGLIILGYPALLLLDGKRKEAIATVLWSAFWLVLILAVYAGLALVRF